MGFTLTTDYSNQFEFEGRSYEIDTAFDTILTVFELLEDDLFLDFEKVTISLELFLDEAFEGDDWERYFRLFKYIFKQYLEIDFDNKSEENGTKTHDFKQDAELIYASFFSAYNIDLLEVKGELPWHKFIKLLRQLDKDSPFKTAVGYRVMKIPPETKYNKEQVKEYKRMQKLYSLEKEAPTKEAQDSKLDSAFAAFKGGGK